LGGGRAAVTSPGVWEIAYGPNPRVKSRRAREGDQLLPVTRRTGPVARPSRDPCRLLPCCPGTVRSAGSLCRPRRRPATGM